jgi:hypothetical protein
MELGMNRLGVLTALVAFVVSGCGAQATMVHTQSAHQVSLATDDVCRTEYMTLVTAVEAYLAMTGGELPASEGDLVVARLLREDVRDFDILMADGMHEVVPAGDRCAGFDPASATAVPVTEPPPDQPPCAVQHKILQIASEAYTAEHGSPPVTQADLVPLYLRVELEGFDLVASQIVPVPGVCT